MTVEQKEGAVSDVRIMVYIGEDDQMWAYENDRGDEPDDGQFIRSVPRSLWQTYTAARAAMSQAMGAVLDAAGCDQDECRLSKCCSTWDGYITPGRVWWEVCLRSDGTGQTWPAHGPARIHSMDTCPLDQKPCTHWSCLVDVCVDAKKDRGTGGETVTTDSAEGGDR